MVTMATVYPEDQLADDRRTTRKSSITQYKDAPLTVMVGGVPVPLVYDAVDYIDCECIHAHPAFVVNGDDIGFNFPVGHCRYADDVYTVFDIEGKVVQKPLKGAYSYLAYESGVTFYNADNGAIGTHNDINLRVGLDYVVAHTMLKGED